MDTPTTPPVNPITPEPTALAPVPAPVETAPVTTPTPAPEVPVSPISTTPDPVKPDAPTLDAPVPTIRGGAKEIGQAIDADAKAAFDDVVEKVVAFKDKVKQAAHNAGVELEALEASLDAYVESFGKAPATTAPTVIK